MGGGCGGGGGVVVVVVVVVMVVVAWWLWLWWLQWWSGGAGCGIGGGGNNDPMIVRRLKSVRRYRHIIRRNKMIRCLICNQSYSRRDALRRHERNVPGSGKKYRPVTTIEGKNISTSLFYDGDWAQWIREN